MVQSEDAPEEPSSPRYVATPPELLGWRRLLPAAGLKRLCYLLVLPVRPFSEEPKPPAPLPPPEPGVFSPVHTDVARYIDARAEERARIVESKAERTMSFLMLLVPLTVSATVYSIGSGMASNRQASMVFIVIAALLVCGIVASFRAWGILGRQQLSVHTVFDVQNNVWKRVDDHEYARGLIWCASWNEAMNDHIADFVSAARLHAVLAMVLLIVCAGALLDWQVNENRGGQSAPQSSVARLDSLEARIHKLEQAVSDPSASSRRAWKLTRKTYCR